MLSNEEKKLALNCPNKVTSSFSIYCFKAEKKKEVPVIDTKQQKTKKKKKYLTRFRKQNKRHDGDTGIVMMMTIEIMHSSK